MEYKPFPRMFPPTRFTDNRGLTLIETLGAMAMFSLLMILIANMFNLTHSLNFDKTLDQGLRSQSMYLSDRFLETIQNSKTQTINAEGTVLELTLADDSVVLYEYLDNTLLSNSVSIADFEPSNETTPIFSRTTDNVIIVDGILLNKNRRTKISLEVYPRLRP